jgi:hypothetical protein
VAYSVWGGAVPVRIWAERPAWFMQVLSQ